MTGCRDDGGKSVHAHTYKDARTRNVLPADRETEDDKLAHAAVGAAVISGSGMVSLRAAAHSGDGGAAEGPTHGSR
jgi:hypothetical protein